MPREKFPVALCGHMANTYGRCHYGCKPLPQNTPDTPDTGSECRSCGGLMVPRGVFGGGVWATCDRCGTSRWVET